MNNDENKRFENVKNETVEKIKNTENTTKKPSFFIPIFLTLITSVILYFTVGNPLIISLAAVGAFITGVVLDFGLSLKAVKNNDTDNRKNIFHKEVLNLKNIKINSHKEIKNQKDTKKISNLNKINHHKMMDI